MPSVDDSSFIRFLGVMAAAAISTSTCVTLYVATVQLPEIHSGVNSNLAMLNARLDIALLEIERLNRKLDDDDE